MKKLILATMALIIAVMAWGSIIVVYASSGHSTRIVPPTPTSTPKIVHIPEKTMPTVPPQMTNTVLSQGNSNLPQVALTIDDGPTQQYTPQILSILKQYNVHATFFAVGQQVSYFPDLIQQEVADGDIVGDHTWDHADLTTLSADDARNEITQASTQIQQAGAPKPTFFRPPYGAINDTVKTLSFQQGMTPTLWDVDTEDWQLPGVDSIVQTALSNATNGSIILMHDGGGDRSQTVAALPKIIAGLQQRGFQLVTIPQLQAGVQSTSTQVSAPVTTAFVMQGSNDAVLPTRHF